MFTTLPATVESFMDWEWEQIAPFFAQLAARPLSTSTIDSWLEDWSQLANLVSERFSRLHVATSVDTTDEQSEAARNFFLETIYPQVQRAEQELIMKLLDSELVPVGMEIPIKKMRTDAELFREENLPLRTQELKLGSEYNKIAGAQTVQWGEEVKTATQLGKDMLTPDRRARQEIWEAIATRQLDDRQQLNELWQELLELRGQIAANGGFDNYRQYAWKERKRYDYTAQDSRIFHQAIKEIVVPAANRIYTRYRAEMGVSQLRPWDVHQDVYLLSLPPLAPFAEMAELDKTAARMFRRLDPVLAGYFDGMRAAGLLDLDNRVGKGPGGYCTFFPVAQHSFIFMNAVGTAGDVRTMLHEAGHAFHNYEAIAALPYIQQRHPGAEFAEVASMSMELLAAPFMAAADGGFYADPAEASRHRVEHLSKIILFWPYMAVVDAFQHWVYENQALSSDPQQCDARWAELWREFLPAVDYTGYENVLQTGWHRKQHIFRRPFYYVEYGMAQVGALQVWRQSMIDTPAAVARYRRALSLGGTRSLPELFAAAGAEFRFDHQVLADMVALLETEIARLL